MHTANASPLGPEGLFFDDEDGDHWAGVGITLTLMYAQTAHELLPAYQRMLEVFDDYLHPIALDSFIRRNWQDYTPRKMKRLLKTFAKEFDYDEELVLGKLGGPYQHYGEYGVRLKGRLFRSGGYRDTGVSAAYFEMPASEVQRVGRDTLLTLVREMARITPFVHGQCGLAFQYFHRAGRYQTDEWIGEQLQRYSAIHPFADSWEYYSRQHLPNVNWVTLLGTDLQQPLGDDWPSRLSPSVQVEALPHGAMLVAGDVPPLGELALKGADTLPLREVAELVAPILLPRDTQSSNILNSFLYEEEDRMRWLDRFKG